MHSASIRFLLASCLAASLAACGGGSDDTASPGTLSGLAATGAPIASAAVTAKCVKGPDLSGSTDANGTFSLALTTNHTAPCMLKVTYGSPAVTLYSFANAAGQVNISPITDMIVTKAMGSDPVAAYSAFDATRGSTIASNLATAKSYVQGQLATILGVGTSADPLSGKFSVGDSDDKVLDALAAALAKAGKAVADLRSGVPSELVPAYLAAPGGVSATANSASQITLNWSSVTGAAGYNVYRSASTGVTIVAGNKVNSTVLSTAAAYADTGLSAGTTYYYKVTAVIGTAVTSAASAEVAATTSAAAAPAAPTGASATANSASQITVNWSAVAGATGYNVYRSNASGSLGSKLNSTTVSAAGAYADTGLTASTAYYYTVKAVNGSGEGAGSTQVSATTSAAAGGGGGGTTPNPSGITLASKSPAVATDVASMVGHYAMPEGLLNGAASLISSCTLDVAADGTFTLAGGGYSYTASVTGKTYLGNNLDGIFGTNGNYTVTAWDAAKTTSMSTTVQNGYVVKVAAPGLTCAFRNQVITSAGSADDSSAIKHSTASKMDAAHVGTYLNADNCKLTISATGSFHLTLPVATTLSSSSTGAAKVASNPTALDVTTILGGDFDDKMGGIWVTYANGIGGNVQIIPTDIRLLDGHYVSISFYQSKNLAGLGGAVSTTVTYLDTPADQLSTSARAQCDNMVQQ